MAAVALVGTLDTKGADFAFLAQRLRDAGPSRPTEVFWPGRGVSALDADGQPFRDTGADEACRVAVERELKASGLVLRVMDAHINDPLFATAVADRLHQMITEGS